jgi:hypothetical protein
LVFLFRITSEANAFLTATGPEKYSDRGIIPRTLSYLFGVFAAVVCCLVFMFFGNLANTPSVQTPDREYTTQIFIFFD